MRLYEVLVVLALSCALTTSEYDEPRVHKQAYDYGKYEKPARYKFGWESKDGNGNSYGHEESRDQDRTTGSYYVHLPDGRLQKVTYYVDGNSGFQATVTYEGEAKPSYKSTPTVPYAEPLITPKYHRPSYLAKPINPTVPKEKSYIAKEVYPTSYKTNPFYETPYNGRNSAGPKMVDTSVAKYPVLEAKLTETPKYFTPQQFPARPKVMESVDVPQEYLTLDNKYAQTQKYSVPQQIQYTQYTRQPQYKHQNIPEASAQDVEPSTRVPPVTLDGVYIENYRPQTESLTYSKESTVKSPKSGEENRTPKPYASIKLTEKQSTYVPVYEPKPVSNGRVLHSTIKPVAKKDSQIISDPLSNSHTTPELNPRKKTYNLSPSYTSVGSPNSTLTYPKNTKENGSYKAEESSF